MDVMRPQSPRVSAPAAARDPKTFAPPGEPFGSPDEPLIEEIIESRFMPEFLRERIARVSSRINDHVFRSRPAGAPVAPQPGSWTFSAIGDYGTGTKIQSDVASNVLAARPDLVLTLGDNVYSLGTERDWRTKFDPPELMGNILRTIPVMPALGNHDTALSSHPAPYFKRFPALEGARYYSYDHKGVHFTVVNSTEALEPGSAQYEWLRRDLDAAKGADFRVLYMHHPLQPDVPNGQGSLGPVLAQYGVDLVLTGHQHHYERTNALNDYGTIQVVAGGGGNSMLHPWFREQPAWSAYRDADFGHLDIEVRGDALVGRQRLRDGSTGDTFVIPKRPH